MPFCDYRHPSTAASRIAESLFQERLFRRTSDKVVLGGVVCAACYNIFETFFGVCPCCCVLCRGRSPKTLDGLRKRIAGLFLTCCQNPALNPEAARLRVNAVGPNGPEAFEYVLEQQAVE
jgi:hypothetical protein